MQQSREITGTFPSGWYLVRGAGIDPARRLHLSIGHDAVGAPRAIVPLAPADRNGLLSSTAVLTHDVTDVLLIADDSGPPPRFERLELRRVSRIEAMLRMLRGLRGTMVRTALDAAALASSTGMGRAAGLVVARYYSNLSRDSARPEMNAPADLRLGAWPLAIPMQLQPLKHLDWVEDGEGAGTWEATGEDPCFRLADHGMAVPLKASIKRIA